MISRQKTGSIMRITLALLLLTVFIAGTAAGCATTPKYTSNPVEDREVLSQVSTVNALLDGIYDGVITCGALKGYGDIGVGTFDRLDGEMIVADGEVYQIKADGIAYLVPDSLGTPFACVTFFDADYSTPLPENTNYEQMQKLMDGSLPTTNAFYAMRIDGTFSYMKTRSVPSQNKPYPILSEVTKNQAVFEFNDVSGTVVGFRCPDYVSGVNVPIRKRAAKYWNSAQRKRPFLRTIPTSFS
jgi:acetolactate decarboxylase